MKQAKIRLLFVCMGNICRSPSAEAVMRALVEKQGLAKYFQIDSAGILGYHEGELPDRRMRAHAARRGYDLTSRSRPVRMEDFYDFEIIIGMDDQNIADLKRLAPDVDSMQKIHRMTDFSPDSLFDHVPDPYYGGAEGFELVLNLLEKACEGLLNICKSEHLKM